MLAWSAGADARPRTLAALGVLVVVTLVVVRADSPGNEGILLGAFALTGIAGHAYGRRDREGAAALATASRLRSEHEAAAERAVRAERLRLARELHDVASHAVGAMVLQAGAALALRERDPAAARAALRTVEPPAARRSASWPCCSGCSTRRRAGRAPTTTATSRRPGRARRPHARRRPRRSPHAPRTRCPTTPCWSPPRSGSSRRRSPTPPATPRAAASRSTLETAADRLAITVADDGAADGATATAAAEGGGFGLVGLAERVRALGGDLAAGPAPGGGFAVSARLPTRAGAAA